MPGRIRGEMIQLPYFLIGNVIAIALSALAFYEAGVKGRIVILVLVGATFLVPKLVPGLTISYLMVAARMVIGIGCTIFIRWRNA